MRFLFIFPHPDDESFGPAKAISRLKREGHEVYLLTLTRGGATKVRHQLNLSIDAMGELRYLEMLDVQRVLGLDGMEVLDFVDSGLKGMDPRALEAAVGDFIERWQPNIVVTYPVHGISGFHDHLVTHAVVKRQYLLASEGPAGAHLKRLAFFTISEEEAAGGSQGLFRLSGSKEEEIGCRMELTEGDMKRMDEALACYKSYQEVIANSIALGPRNPVAYFELFGERRTQPLSHLTEDI